MARRPAERTDSVTRSRVVAPVMPGWNLQPHAAFRIRRSRVLRASPCASPDKGWLRPAGSRLQREPAVRFAHVAFVPSNRRPTNAQTGLLACCHNGGWLAWDTLHALVRARRDR